MAKLGLINNNELKKKIIENKKKTRLVLKEKIKNKELTLLERLDLVRKLSEMPRNSSRIRYRNRCGLTGRPRAYYRAFGISRIALRELGSHGYIPGLTKSSW